MSTQEPRMESFLEDLEEILSKRYSEAGELHDHEKKPNVSESDLLRQIRIRLARFRQGY